MWQPRETLSDHDLKYDVITNGRHANVFSTSTLYTLFEATL